MGKGHTDKTSSRAQVSLRLCDEVHTQQDDPGDVKPDSAVIKQVSVKFTVHDPGIHQETAAMQRMRIQNRRIQVETEVPGRITGRG